jgi:ATP-dependent Lhr-like helicase
MRATPVALFLREHLRSWRALAAVDRPHAPFVSDVGHRVIAALTEGGAQFSHEIAARLSASVDEVRTALAELVWAGLIASDGFSGLRAIWNGQPPPRSFQSRSGRGATPPGGRWARLAEDVESDRERAIEHYAAVLLQRYGVVCRRLLMREPFPVPWRELLRVYRGMEARGQVRGGRFVSGLHGEQFALPEAVELARRIRRTPPSGEVIEISAADPLNLCGIIIPGERIPAIASTRIAFRDGVPMHAEDTERLLAGA